jgi:alpha-galactosidase
MTAASPAMNSLLHLHSAGCSLLVEVTDGQLPAVVHWGAELEPQTDASAAELVRATQTHPGPNAVSAPTRVSLLPEHSTGWVGRPGLRGSRGGPGWSTRFVVTEVCFDGVPVDGFLDAGPGLVTVQAEEAGAQLGLRIDVEMLASGLIRARAAVTNFGAAYAVDDLVIALPVPACATEVFDFAGRWGMERLPQRRPFTVGTHLREGRKGRTGADAATVLHVLEPGADFARGEAWGVHTAWSGNHTHYAERTFTDHRVIGGGELLLPGEVTLTTGETYETPWVYGSYGVGLDAVAHRFHRYLRGRSHHPGHDRPVTLNVWEAVYFDHDAARLITLAQLAADIGIERFVLDDGWFGSRRDDRSGLGDWVVSDEVWPDGLHPLVDAVTGLGMQFGLWFEPEMVNPDSDVARAHPDWIMAARAEWPVEARHQQVLNLAIPEAYRHVRDQIVAILDEYDISYIKWDHNRDLIEAGNQQAGGQAAVHAQTRAVYRLLDEIRARYPDLEIESCSSGGARVDLGILERTDRVWVSDCIDPLERQRMLRWTGQLIPPELMGSHIASPHSHTTGRNHDLPFRAVTAFFGHLGVEWDIASASAEERKELAAWIAAHKENRELIMSGDVVRGPDTTDGMWVHGVVSSDRRTGLFAIAALAWTPAVPAPRVRLRGLDPHLHYDIEPVVVGTPDPGLTVPLWWRDRLTLSGGALEWVGIQPPSMQPESAVLIRVTASKEG